MSVQQKSKKQDSLKKQSGFVAKHQQKLISYGFACYINSFMHLPSTSPIPGTLCLSSSWHPCQTTAINSLINMVTVKLATSFEDGHGSVLSCCSLTGAGSLV